MEYEKSSEKFQFGFGSMTTAGKGDVRNAQEVPKEIKTKVHYDAKTIAKSAVKAAILSAVVLVKHKKGKRKKK